MKRFIVWTGGVLLLLGIWGLFQMERRRGPSWIDTRDGDGAVLSVAGGRNPVGEEVIVAGGYYRSSDSGRDLKLVSLRAKDGSRLWEVAEPPSLPNMSRVPAVRIDRSGDVVVGWDYWSLGRGSATLITKYSGGNGTVLWQWAAEAQGPQSGHLAVPTPDGQGRIWVSGIRKRDGVYQRFLALLEGSDGRQHWFWPLNPADDANDRRASVEPLSDGDAVVIVPPEGGEKSCPWLIQRVSGADGSLQWSHKIVRANERNLQGLAWLLDERAGQLVAAWSEVVGGRHKTSVVAFDLQSGRERWRSSDPAVVDLKEWVDALNSIDAGEIILWTWQVTETVRTNWLRWSKDSEMPFPMPERTYEQWEQPLRIHLSAADGRTIGRRVIARPGERLQRILKTTTHVVLILRSAVARAQVEPWRAVETSGARLREFASGDEASLQFPRQAALTPGGGLALGHESTRDSRRWEIRFWNAP